MALNRDRVLDEKKVAHGPEFGHDVAKGFRVFRHSLCVLLNDGTVAPAGAVNPPAPVIGVLGLALEYRDETKQANLPPRIDDKKLWVINGCFALPFAETAPGWADVGKDVFAVDDEFVSLTGTPEEGAARLKAGTLVGFEQNGTAYVLIGGLHAN